jgi:V8-like Glu-specific endopeptidase
MLPNRTKLSAEQLECRVVPTVFSPVDWVETNPREMKIVRIQALFPDGQWYSGSGFLVGYNHVVTAGHVLYDNTVGGWAKSIKVQRLDSRSASIYTSNATQMRVGPTWSSARDFNVSVR